ncbi:hypothetical protein EYF80_031603 [Liparis tanakae]|uniref:Uncharacterized protein n=1 Tax=Liparis tanakae TaxID=230148 RepID=A0A4Z2GY24_9TELE|nr:hypothetical protein EYF80_031603 [Liparis tanakae]
MSALLLHALRRVDFMTMFRVPESLSVRRESDQLHSGAEDKTSLSSSLSSRSQHEDEQIEVHRGASPMNMRSLDMAVRASLWQLK